MVGTRTLWRYLTGIGAAMAVSLALAGSASADVSFCAPGTAAGQCNNPRSVAVNEESGEVFVADAGNNRIDVFDGAGGFLRAFGWGVATGAAELQVCTASCHVGIAGLGDGEFDEPSGIAVDNDPLSPAFGDVFVFDQDNAGCSDSLRRVHSSPSSAAPARGLDSSRNLSGLRSDRGDRLRRRQPCEIRLRTNMSPACRSSTQAAG